MISLIICSTHAVLQPPLVDNIRATIGVDYEIIHIDNSQRKYNIFEAYNIGMESSHGQFLCFMHEDVRFNEKGWGKVVEETLSNSEIGALGVAGGHMVLNQLDWRFYGFGEVFLRQGNTSIEPSPIYYYSGSYAPSHISRGLKQVAVIDGVWMCFRKSLFEHIRFDDQNFHDFHLYDSDICMQVNELGKGVFITDEVFLEHRSEGTFTEGYRNSLNIFFKKWGSSLPLIKGVILNKEEIEKALPEAYRRFDERLKHDAIALEIRKLIQLKQAGKPTRSFTREEEEAMEYSSFVARKALIKNKSVSTATAWKHTKEYLHYPFANRKCKLLLKFFWYRFIKRWSQMS